MDLAHVSTQARALAGRVRREHVLAAASWAVVAGGVALAVSAVRTSRRRRSRRRLERTFSTLAQAAFAAAWLSQPRPARRAAGASAARAPEAAEGPPDRADFLPEEEPRAGEERDPVLESSMESFPGSDAPAHHRTD